MVKELNHIGIRCGDIDAAVNFYVNVLGGTIIRDAKGADGNGRFVYVQICNGVVELIKGKPDNPDNGLVHVAFLLKDDCKIEDAHKKLIDEGYRITVAPKLSSSGDGMLMFFEESSGTIFEFIQRKENIRIPGLKNDNFLEFDHSSIRVTDESYKKCEDFYLNELGFKVRKILSKSDTVMSYYILGEDTIETLYSEGKPKVARPLGHLAFRVKDAFETKKYLESKGVECPEPKESAMKGFNILNIKAPDGVAIEFVDRKALEEM